MNSKILKIIILKMKKILFSGIFILPLASAFYILKDRLTKRYSKRIQDQETLKFQLKNYGLEDGPQTDELVFNQFKE